MNIDQLFERRELTRILNVPAKYVQRNIRGSILAQLSSTVEGKCGVEGYIQPKSSVILEHSLGKVDMLSTGIQYKVRFHADVCYPHSGQILKAPVTFRSKIGIHAELTPLRILVPRDLHIGNADFDAINDGDEIIFKVVKSDFKQNDESIFVLGELVQRVGVQASETVEEEPEIREIIPVAKESTSEGEIKQVAIKETPAIASPDNKPVRRRKRLNPGSSLQVNVGETKEGESEGQD